MSRGSRSSRGTTIREGTEEWNWYALAAYVASSILGVAFIGFSMYQADTIGGGITITVVVIGLSIFALVTYPALFKDSVYVCGTAARWNPKWWFYIGGPILVTAGVYVIADAIGVEVGATEIGSGVFVLFIFLVATAASNAYYLYQRHRFVRIP